MATARRMTFICRAVCLVSAATLAGAVIAQSSSKGDPARGAGKAAACDSCHGTPERRPLAGTPYLAGQQPQFLELQMILLREGLRDVPQMAGMLNGVPDRELADIAAYFGAQTPPRNDTQPAAKLRERGAQLAQAMGCGSCHMEDFRGQQQVPRLTNQREDYLVASLLAYRDNKRTGIDTNMNGILYRVTDSDIQALAHYLAHQ